MDEGYQPPRDFYEDERESLIDIQLNDSTELWLIQWPINQPVDFDGQQVELNLNKGRQLGTLADVSGKSFDVVDVGYQGPEAVVFVPSTNETRIAGKISKHVSLINYPEASELKQRRDNRSTSSTISGRRTKSTITGSAGHSKSGKRKRAEGSSRSGGHSGNSSGRGSSGVSSSGSKGGRSEERSSKKRKEK